MMSIQEFAAKVGRQGRQVREAAKAFHVAYVGATPEQQADLRRRWMLGHLEGQQVTEPERVLSRGKGKGAKKADVAAIDRAYSDFRYYVVQPEKARAKAAPAGSGKSDPVADLLEAYNALTAAQQRRFKSSI
jgi:hypothetical protein